MKSQHIFSSLYLSFSIILILACSIPAKGASWTKIVRDVADTAKSVSETIENVSETQTADTDALIKRADTLLRNSQRRMFSGQKDEALELLNEAGDLIVQVRTSDPDNKKLKSLTQKYERQRRDLSKRMGKEIASKLEPEKTDDTAAVTEDTTEPETDTEAKKTDTATTRSQKLPYHARQEMDNFKKMNRTLEYNFTKLEQAKTEEQSMPLEKRYQAIEDNKKEMEKILAEARRKAAEKGVMDHPDFIEAQETIEAIPGRLSKARGELTEIKSAQQASATDKANDIAELRKEYERLRDKIFNKASGVAIYYNDLEPVKELLALLEEFEKNEMGKAQAFLDAFAKKYGSTEDEIKKALDDWQPAGTFTKFKEGLENIGKTRVAMAEDLVRKTKSRLDNLSGLHDFYRIKGHSTAREWLAMAKAFKPTNASVNELEQTLDGKLARDMQAFKKKIADRTWPDHADNAPKNAKKLAGIALDFFKNSPDWGKRPPDKEGREPLAVAVTGPWSIQARNILGEPIMYGLPIKLAVAVPEEKKDGLARVYILTMRTEERKGVKQEPPFVSVTVGDSYYLSVDKVK
jgi:hypothetical protein